MGHLQKARQASPWVAERNPGRAKRERLLRGPERDLEGEGDTRRWVERVVPSLDRYTRVAEEVGVVDDRRRRPVARERHLVAVHVEHLAAGVVRIVRLGRADVHAGGVNVSVPRASAGTASADAVAAAGELRIARDRPVHGPIELDPSPKASEIIPAEGRVIAIERQADLPGVVAGTAAVCTGRRGKPGRERRGSGKRRQQQKRTSHRASPLPTWIPQDVAAHPEAVVVEGQIAGVKSDAHY